MTKFREGVAGFILNNRNELLIIKLVDYAPDEWTVPGGGVKTGETHVQAIWREIGEEVGLTPQDLLLEKKSDVINTYIFENKSKSTHTGFMGQKKTQFIFRLTNDKEPILQQEELKASKWITLDEIDAHFIFPGQTENAKKVLGL